MWDVMWFLAGILAGVLIMLLWVALDRKVVLLRPGIVVLPQEDYDQMVWFIDRVSRKYRLRKGDLEREEENDDNED